jgi:hypothetical protein
LLLGRRYVYLDYCQFYVLFIVLTVIRKPHRAAKAVVVKTEPVSPKSKRKFKQLLGSDIDEVDDGASLNSSTGKNGKPSKPSKGKQQLDAVVMVRKSNRLNDPPAKRARTDDPVSLFQRLAKEFAAIGKTCEEIAEAMDA